MSSSLSLRGLSILLMVSLLPPPVAAESAPEPVAKQEKKEKKAKKAKKEKADKAEKQADSPKEEAAPKASVPLDPEMPAAGDENIPEEPLEPGQLVPEGRKSGGTSSQASGPSLRISKPTSKGSDALALELDTAAAQRFDEGNYVEAARLWVRGLEALAENESNHVTRAAMLSNAVTAYEQMFVASGDVEPLKRAQQVISDYLRQCKKRWGTGCERYPETSDAHTRMKEVLARIDETQPKIKKIAPEIDTAPGGRSFNRMVRMPPAPAWIGPAFAGGLALIGGGAGLVYFSRTDSRFQESTTTDETVLNSPRVPALDPSRAPARAPALDPEIAWRSADTDTTGDAGTTGDMGDTTDTTTGSTEAIELAPETKGHILLAFGTVAMIAGVGLIVFASLRLAKHRRINRERSSVLTWSPLFSPTGGGLAVSGRF